MKEVRVRVRAGERKDSVAVGKNGVINIAVRAKAERGDANERVREILARHFGVPVSRVHILTGTTRPQKRILVDG